MAADKQPEPADMVDVTAVHTVYTGGPTPFPPGASFRLPRADAEGLSKAGHVHIKGGAPATTPAAPAAPASMVHTPVVHTPGTAPIVSTEPPHPLGPQHAPAEPAPLPQA